MLQVFTADQLPQRIRDGLEAGVTRFLCPKCAGGGSREISLSSSVVEAGGLPIIRFVCHRVSCGWHAQALFGEGENFQFVRGGVHEATVYAEPTFAVTDAHVLLRPESSEGEGFGLRESDLQGRFACSMSNGGELAMEVRGPSGILRGHMTRTFSKPKRCRAYKQSAQPWQDWWLLRASEHPSLHIVEDQISACKIHAAGASSVALLGTNLSIDKAREIALVAEDNGLKLVLWFDNDAAEKAIRIADKYRHILPRMCVSVSKSDPKDMKMKDLKEWIGVR